MDGAWQTRAPLTCAPLDCGRPKIALATIACPLGTTFSQQCVFKCDRPAVLVGKNNVTLIFVSTVHEMTSGARQNSGKVRYVKHCKCAQPVICKIFNLLIGPNDVVRLTLILEFSGHRTSFQAFCRYVMNQQPICRTI